eukprot:scaffold61895_cov23-Tisochrysis_lutea.AAC.3
MTPSLGMYSSTRGRGVWQFAVGSARIQPLHAHSQITQGFCIWFAPPVAPLEGSNFGNLSSSPQHDAVSGLRMRTQMLGVGASMHVQMRGCGCARTERPLDCAANRYQGKVDSG